MANKDRKDSRYRYDLRGVDQYSHEQRMRDLLYPPAMGASDLAYTREAMKDVDFDIAEPGAAKEPMERMDPAEEAEFLAQNEAVGNQIMDEQVRRSAGPGKAY